MLRLVEPRVVGVGPGRNCVIEPWRALLPRRALGSRPEVLAHFPALPAMRAACFASLRARSLRRIMFAVNSTAAVPPPKVPSTGASGRWAAAPVVVSDMSIPGMSAGMPAGLVGVGVLPDMSIPGMSAGMPAGLVGAGGLSAPTRAGTAAALTMVAADDFWCEVSTNDPKTAIARQPRRSRQPRRQRTRNGSAASSGGPHSWVDCGWFRCFDPRTCLW